MPKINPYLIKENQVKIEEVRYLNNEIPSYEEFMRNYELNEAVANIYESEYQDKALNGPQYGPGNTQSKERGKAIAGALLAMASVFPPTAPIAVPITISLTATGAGVASVGLLTDDDSLKTIGKDMLEIGCNAHDLKGRFEENR